MKLCDHVAFKTFHLILFPMHIRFISLHPSKIFHPHTTTMTSIARLTHRRTFEKLMPSKKTTSSRSLPKDMAAPTRRMTLETGPIDDGFDRRPSVTCSLAHDGVGSPKCGVETRFISLHNPFVAFGTEALSFGGRGLLSFMCHLLSLSFIISAVAMNTAEPPMSRF
jgi:hypothetical protein